MRMNGQPRALLVNSCGRMEMCGAIDECAYGRNWGKITAARAMGEGSLN